MPAESSRTRIHDADELARTAAILIDTVQNEANPKFKNSAFMGLMRQLRDGEVIVEGNDMVQRSDSTGAVEIPVDAKGKGRAADFSTPIGQRPFIPAGATSTTRQQTYDESGASRQEDPNDAYFRQENEEYIAMHARQGLGDTRQSSSLRSLPQTVEWEALQRDWDAYEATTRGLRPIANYQFQLNNPYLIGDVSQTRQHASHAGMSETLYEVRRPRPGLFVSSRLLMILPQLQSVLEKEAAVQRDPTNASRWYELGVKQQENEREQKAVQALRRALELDSTLLSAWLALAVSHTNEGSRSGAYNAIREWVERNERYSAAVAQFRALNPESLDATASEQLSYLMQCLMSIVQQHAGGEIDADLQIALAVLLNTNEVRRTPREATY